jgi:hypothetical protein
MPCGAVVHPVLLRGASPTDEEVDVVVDTVVAALPSGAAAGA